MTSGSYSLPRPLSWTLTMLLLLETSVNIVVAIGSFQSGKLNGALYAGGMDYSVGHLFITGISYGTNGGSPSNEAKCFVTKFASLKIESHDDNISGNIGDGRFMHACHAISTLHDPQSKNSGPHKGLLVAGTSDFVNSHSSGFVMGIGPFTGVDNFPIVFDHMTDETAESMSYPVSIAYIKESENTDEGSIFVASLTTSNLAANPDNDKLMNSSNNQPNWLKYYKYGSSFEMKVHKLKASSSAVIEKKWTQIFPIISDNSTNENHDVFLGGLIYKNNKEPFVILAGSTSGSGNGYGVSAPDSNDEDGFITLLNAETGELRNSIRVGTGETDVIMGICDDPNEDAFYIVGATGDANGMGNQVRHHHMVLTTAEGSLHGFVQKIDASTLNRVWGVTWGAKDYQHPDLPDITAGVDCKVLEDGTMYVAGVVENGGHVLRDPEVDIYGDNIVAMNLKTETGELNWVKEFGSKDGHENLAQGGAIAIDLHSNDLILFGDTTGSMFRHREDESDNIPGIFLATLSNKDGSWIFLETASNKDGSYVDGLPGDFKGVHETGGLTEKQSMLFGGNWKDDEVFGHGHWFDKNAMGIQSGPTLGSVFAGGMVYNPDEDAAYVTGISYETNDADDKLSSCMISKLSLNPNQFIGWRGATGKVIGQKNVLEVCSSIALHGYSEVVIIGSGDEGSILPSSQSVKHPMEGFAMVLDRYTLEEVDATPLVTENPELNIQYPVDIVIDGHDLYIVSLTSTDKSETSEYAKVMNSNGEFSPNWINIQKYGTSFDMTVTKVTLSEEMMDGVSMGGISFSEKWKKEYPVDLDIDSGITPRVFLGGTILKKSKGFLAVSGSTRGTGEAYGAATGNDEDGFVTLLDLNTGELSSTVQTNHLREGSDQDELVLGICHDPNDDSSFYVVGATKGKVGVMKSAIAENNVGSMQAYIKKIHADSFLTIWASQLGAIHKNSQTSSTTVKAFDCAVDGHTVYMAGVVDNNASIVWDTKTLNSRGGDDIWLASFSIKDGNIHWVRQMGSEGNDHLAPRGALAIKNSGNILIFGDTNGEFYRQHVSVDRKVNELFMLEVSKEGAFKPHVKHDKIKEIHSIPTAKPHANVPAPTPTNPKYQPGPTTQATAPPFLVNSSDELTKKKGISTGGVVSLILFGVVVCVAIFLAFFVRHKNTKWLATEKPKIEVKDGLITVDKMLPKSPPASLFQHSNEEKEGFSNNLRIEDTEII